jgi:cytochrome c oxidase subunit 4
MSVANESRAEEHTMQEHHSALRYYLVFGALIGLTVLTYVTGRMHLPSFGLALALLIATTKGTLVLLFFMHLVDHKGANRLIMGVSVLFVILMLIFPMADLATRFRPANPAGSHLGDPAMPDLNFPANPKSSTYNRGTNPDHPGGGHP